MYDAAGTSNQAASSGDPGIRGLSAPTGVSARVELRRATSEFGEIVTRTSCLGAGRGRTASTIAAPMAAPRTMPRARKAISDGLTDLLACPEREEVGAVRDLKRPAPRAGVNTIGRSRRTAATPRGVHGEPPA